MIEQLAATKSQIAYVERKIAEWIIAGDVLEKHAELAFRAVLNGFLIMRTAKDITLENWCEQYRTQLKWLDQHPKEFARKKRQLARIRRKMGVQ